jgi:hypothetical protein
MGQGRHSVDMLSTLGYQSVEAGLVHVASQWGTTQFDVRVFNALIPHEYIWPPLLDGDQPPVQPLTISSLAEFPVLEPSSRPVPLMTSRDLVSWWEQQLPDAYAQGLDAGDLFTKPDLLICYGCHRLKHSLAEIWEDTAALGACLSMIGTGAVAMIGSTHCELCRFRQSIPGGLRCASCSRSKQAVDFRDDKMAAARARRALRIRAGASGMDVLPCEDVRASFSRAIASSVWSMRTGCKAHSEWLASVQQALKSAPLVYALLPENFAGLGYSGQARALQAALDEHEWDYAAWPLKISMAQSWLESATAVRSRKRGPGPLPETLARARAALDLLSGGYSKRDVARALGVSPSHLSHLLRRTSGHLG